MNALGGLHLSAAELADLKLPALPGTKRKINERAKREGWSFIDRPGRGGGRLYSIADLPAEARAVLEQRRARRLPANDRPVGRPKGTDFFTLNPDVADAVEAIIAERQLAAPRVLELLSQTFVDLPSRRTLSRFMAKLEREKPALLASFRNPDAYKSRYKVALGRADGSVTYAHEAWELDGTSADVHTKRGRKTILGLIDRFSRRTRFLVAESESSQSVRRLLTTTIQAWGVMPDMLITDNGSGFIADATIAAFETLDIAHRRCKPGVPEDKPHVERVFGTFTRERAELLAGFAGHNVAEAQALRSQAKKETGRALIVPELEPEELQAILDAWCDGVYHTRPHSMLRTSPMQKWMSSKVPVRPAPSDDVLKVAFSARIGAVKVGKRGVQWKRGRYWSPRLAEYMGRVVEIRLDEDDLGALFVFDEDGHYIDTAVNHERAGLSERAFAEAAARQQAEHMREAREALRAKKRAFSFEKARDSLLREDAEKAGKLVILPPVTAARPNPAEESIVQAPKPVLPSKASLDAAIASTEPRRKTAAVPPSEKVAQADTVLDAAARGLPVDQHELRRARLYAQSTEYKTEKLLTGAFGRPASSRSTTPHAGAAG